MKCQALVNFEVLGSASQTPKNRRQTPWVDLGVQIGVINCLICIEARCWARGPCLIWSLAFVLDQPKLISLLVSSTFQESEFQQCGFYMGTWGLQGGPRRMRSSVKPSHETWVGQGACAISQSIYNKQHHQCSTKGNVRVEAKFQWNELFQ